MGKEADEEAEVKKEKGQEDEVDVEQAVEAGEEAEAGRTWRGTPGGRTGVEVRRPEWERSRRSRQAKRVSRWPRAGGRQSSTSERPRPGDCQTPMGGDHRRA